MSCEQKSSKFARLVCQLSTGISALTSKRSFYAGLAVGAVGTAGVVTLINQLRRANSSPFIQPVAGSAMIAPETAIGLPGKPIQRTPEAASVAKSSRKVRGTRAKPIELSKTALDALKKTDTSKGTLANPKPIPVFNAPAALAAETKLKPDLIRMRVGADQTFTPQQSYRVVRSDGGDTGLAITPMVRQGEEGQFVEDQSTWGLTHSGSGSLISGPFDSISQAQELAGQLSALRWTATTVPAADVARARQIINVYRQPSGERQEA